MKMAQIHSDSICPRCGNNLPASVKFCNACGAAITPTVGAVVPTPLSFIGKSPSHAPNLIPGTPLPAGGGAPEVPGISKATLREWLQKFGIPNERIFEMPPEKILQAPPGERAVLENFLIIPYKLMFKGPKGELPLVFEVKMMIIKKWINIKLMLMRHEEVPLNLKPTLHEKLLNANFDLNEVTYSVSQQGDVFVEADMPTNTDYTNFQSEYGSIEFGVIHFLKEILPKLTNVQAKGTYKESLYI